MEWWQIGTLATAAPVAPDSSSSESLTTALIAVLGTVLVALITVGLPLLFKQARTTESPPLPDPKLNERVAVNERLLADDRTVLDVIDRRLDRTEFNVEGHDDRITRLENIIEGLQWRTSADGGPGTDWRRP